MTDRPTDGSTAIVVALTDPAPPHLLEGINRFAEEAGEVLLVDASGTSAVAEMAARFANVRVLARPAGRLAPELWRDGLLATEASLVALTTAQMVPRPGWIGAMKARMFESGAAGVGGPIAPGPGLSATDRAVALLRYSGYFPFSSTLPLGEGRKRDVARPPAPETGLFDTHPTCHDPHPRPLCQWERGGRLVDPPGDNALYHRDRLMAVAASWLDGFWEVEVHEALRARGETLAMTDRAVVDFRGGVGLASMIRQRFRHARQYAAGRSADLSPLARWSRIAASPMVPPLLVLRAARALRAKQIPLGPWLTALAPMVGLASAWAVGEAVGTRPDDQRRRPMLQPIREVA